MTRFDAQGADGRRELIADAIAAHRERGSLFCTVEAEGPPPGAGEHGEPTEQAGDPDAAADTEPTPAWVQYTDTDAQLNLDCTDAEYDRITDVLGAASAFTVAEQSSPEDADGRNLRITARTDVERIAEIVDRLFVEGFGYDAEFRLWATEI